MAKYISGPQIIEAEQFRPIRFMPKGVFGIIKFNDAYEGSVMTIQGETVDIKEGEWVVQEPDDPNRHYPISDLVFQKKYKPYNEQECMLSLVNAFVEEYDKYIFDNNMEDHLKNSSVEQIAHNAAKRFLTSINTP